VAEKVDAPPGRVTDLGIDHIDADMLVDQQREPRAQHEQRRMHVKHAFLRGDGVDAEDIAPDHDAELHQHHEQRQPANAACHGAVHPVDRVGQSQHHPCPVDRGARHAPRTVCGSVPEDTGAGVHLAVIGVGLVSADKVAVGDDAFGDAAHQLVIIVKIFLHDLFGGIAHGGDHVIGQYAASR
jgi:hypothetical protein